MSDSDTSTHSSLKSTEERHTNLVDNGVANEIKAITQSDGLAPTSTDMNFQYFQNSDVLIPEEERTGFSKEPMQTIIEESESRTPPMATHIAHADSDSSDDSLDKYHNAPPEATAAGPAYGSGQTYPAENTREKVKDGPFEGESYEDYMLRKLDMLRKLGELTQYGVKLSQKYTIESDYNSMMYEYELHRSIRSKQNGVKFLSGLMMNMVTGLEFLNEKYNPFNFKLRGWAEHMNRDVTSYYDVFGELYEKYSGPGESVAPEIKLLMMISTSAIQFHLANSMLGGTQSAGDKFAENPELLNQLKQQAMREQQAKEQEAMKNLMEAQHKEAAQKASDIQFLNKMKAEHMAKQAAAAAAAQASTGQLPNPVDVARQQAMMAQMAQQQVMNGGAMARQQKLAQQQVMNGGAMARQQKLAQLAQLQQKLAQTKMESERAITGQPTIKKPTLPAGMAATMTPAQVHEFNRNMQIRQHAQQMQLQELQRQAAMQQSLSDHHSVDTRSRRSRRTSDTTSVGRLKPDLDKLLNVEEMSEATSSLDTRSKDSKVSIKKRRSRKRKPGIKVETSSV